MLLTARQICRAPLNISSVNTSLPRALPRASLSHSYFAQRGFSSSHVFRDESSKVHCGIAVTNQPGRTASKHGFGMLYRQFQPLDLSRHSDATSTHWRLAMLFTPTYADCALKPTLLKRTFGRLIGGPKGGARSLEGLAAVVDRLPNINGSTVEGQEGIAYVLIPGSNSSTAASPKPFNEAAQKPGSMTFQFPAPGNENITHNVQLPLAQTIFSTGLVSTLVQTQFACDEGSNELKLLSSRKLESHAMELPSSAPSSSIGLHTPLVPLTPLRVVRNSMGNIIRTVSSATAFEEIRTDAVPSNPQPASSELEEAVTAYFKAKGIPPEPVSVWSLILPQDIGWLGFANEPRQTEELKLATSDMIRSLWAADPASSPLIQGFPSALLSLFRRGARLTKVLSGGGGWGKKAGLLSLDPDAEYATRDLRGDEGWEFDFSDESESGIEKQQRQALGEIVREGESVMFFIAPKDATFQDVLKDMKGEKGQESQTIVFGTIPSTVDSIPAQDSGVIEVEPDVQFHNNVFGALSESGLALNLTNGSGSITKTKFDVPYSVIYAAE